MLVSRNQAFPCSSLKPGNQSLEYWSMLKTVSLITINKQPHWSYLLEYRWDFTSEILQSHYRFRNFKYNMLETLVKKSRKSYEVFYCRFSSDLLCILIFQLQTTFSLRLHSRSSYWCSVSCWIWCSQYPIFLKKAARTSLGGMAAKHWSSVPWFVYCLVPSIPSALLLRGRQGFCPMPSLYSHSAIFLPLWVCFLPFPTVHRHLSLQ